MAFYVKIISVCTQNMKSKKFENSNLVILIKTTKYSTECDMFVYSKTYFYLYQIYFLKD